MNFDKYIPIGHKPNSRPLSEMYAEAMREILLPVPAVHISDFPRLDHMTGGFRPKEFSILCGATGVGKTCLLANLSASLVKQRVPHFVASVETGSIDFVKRVISVLDGKDHNKGDAISVEVMKKFHAIHGGHLESDYLNLSLYDNRFSVETLMADITWHVQNKGIKIALIDNLNFFMEVTRAADQVVEMDRVIHELIIFCKNIDVHVVMVMHPRKTEHGRVESEFDIKGSSTAVQESHNIFLFNRAHPDLVKAGVARENDRQLKIVKMRRRGGNIGRSLIFGCVNGVAYNEGEIV